MWTSRDAEQGRCLPMEVGQEKQCPSNKAPVSPEQSTTCKVKEDATTALDSYGRVAYLVNHPKFFQRCLEATLAEAPPPQLVQIALSRQAQ